jgi:hypothetical protein
MLLQDFINKLKLIKAKSYIQTKRKGPTGIGYTLETLLEIKENNIALPDLEIAELKARRSNSQSMITLFTFNRKVWKINPMEAINKYGSYDQNGRKGLYYTMSLKPNGAGLFLEVLDTEISVRHISGEIVATWQMESLVESFVKKFPALILVTAQTEERDGLEYFYYDRAMLMEGTNPHILANQFREGNILVDLRFRIENNVDFDQTSLKVFDKYSYFSFKNIKDLGI